MLTCGLKIAGIEWVSSIARIAPTDGVVVVDRAGGMSATDPGTWVPALLVHAGQVGGTLLVDGALGLALNIGVAPEAGQALAGGRTVPVIANCIDSTGGGVAGVNYIRPWGSSCDPSALRKGISSVALVADTNWNMVSDAAVGIGATQTGAGVQAVLRDARQFLRAVGVDDTLRPAVGWRANHVAPAGTLTSITNLSGKVAIGTTWIWITWVLCNDWLNG
jgi:hypothetical protein